MPHPLLLQKPTYLDLHCLQRQGISGFNRTRVKVHFFFFFKSKSIYKFYFFVEVDHEIYSAVIFSLPLAQEGQLSLLPNMHKYWLTT